MEKPFHMCRVVLAKLFVFGLLALNASQVSAVTLLADDRFTFRQSDAGNVLITPDAPFADFAALRQTSVVGANGFSGNGRANAEDDFFFFVEESVFDVTFSVAVETLIDLQGILTGENGQGGVGFSEVALYSGSTTFGPLVFGSTGGFDDSVPFSFTDTLAVGTYRLVINTDISPAVFGTFASWEFTADFTAVPVPIPAMGWLMFLSVASLFRRRKTT